MSDNKENKVIQTVFSGKPYYANKKRKELEKSGYTLVRWVHYICDGIRQD